MSTFAAPISQQRRNALTVSPAPSRILQRKCTCGGTPLSGGECAECKKKRSLQRRSQQGAADFSFLPSRDPVIQTQLAVGASNDPLEVEADRVADQVLAAPTHFAIGGGPPVQRFTEQPAGHAVTAPASVENVLAQRGVPMETALRQDMERRFGQDFSQVRVHTNSTARQSAREVSADAYTVGHNVVFGDGKYSPATHQGKRLIAHELTHVVQQRGRPSLIQRSLAGCQELLKNPSAISILSGSLVHALIAEHFAATVAGATNVLIPGGSAGALRSQGICGGEDKIINPQIVGGRAGAGFPDLARITPEGILQVAEIKPAVIICLIDGEQQLLRYVEQGNAFDASQSAWRATQGISGVEPMPESTYSPPTRTLAIPGLGTFELQAAWCSPGLLSYSVKKIGKGPPVPITKSADAKDKKQKPAKDPTPVAIPGPGKQPIPQAARSRLSRVIDFLEELVAAGIKSGAKLDSAIGDFLQANPDLINVVIAAGVSVIIATIAEDFATGGLGILDDFVMIPIVARVITLARQAAAAAALVGGTAPAFAR